MKTYYIAGPMSYRPQFNFPLFDRVAAELREEGLTVLSPAELDAPEVREAALASPDGMPEEEGGTQMAGETWADFLARDVKLIADHVDAIVLLHDWHNSRGARLEAFVGLLCGKGFYTYDARGLHAVCREYVQDHVV